MSALVVLAVLVVFAVLAPFLGIDSRWEGADVRPDRPRRRARWARSATDVPRQRRRPLPAPAVNDTLSEAC